MGTTFSYSDAKNKKHTLTLRHNPYSVNWNYNVITQTQETYTGEVIQVLGVNIDNLVIEGQLGAEGPYGMNEVDGDKIRERNFTQQFSSTGKYVGLHGMVEFFREYFAIMSQGADKEIEGQYRQTPMTLGYDVKSEPDSRFWPQIIPINFPSFKRSIENFAPMWRIEAHVLEADKKIQATNKKQALQRIQQGIGYKVGNPFSDPRISEPEIIDTITSLYTGFRALLPSYTQQELQELVWNGVTVPRFADMSQPVSASAADFLEGEENVYIKRPNTVRGGD